MTEPFGVTPCELRATASYLAEVSSRMKGMLSSLRAQLAGEGAAWGNDSIGHQFASCANGYLAQADWVEGSVDAKTNLLDDYSDQLRNAADTFEQSDERSFHNQLPCEHRSSAPSSGFRTLTPGAWKGSAYNQQISNGESPKLVTFDEQKWSRSNERQHKDVVCAVDQPIENTFGVDRVGKQRDGAWVSPDNEGFWDHVLASRPAKLLAEGVLCELVDEAKANQQAFQTGVRTRAVQLIFDLLPADAAYVMRTLHPRPTRDWT
jgi:uncharacterized protein YukE